MNQDFVDLLQSFIDHDVRFMVVGAYALAVHGRPRATGDLDVWVEATPENAACVMNALGAMRVPVIGREAFVRNKRATGRAKDLGDIEDLT